MPRLSYLAAAGAVGLIGLAVALNPSPERHREEIREVLSGRSQVAGALGVGSLAAFASSYHSLGVASYTKVGGSTMSVGAFGLVIVM
jgi:hypothetical protein